MATSAAARKLQGTDQLPANPHQWRGEKSKSKEEVEPVAIGSQMPQAGQNQETPQSDVNRAVGIGDYVVANT